MEALTPTEEPAEPCSEQILEPLARALERRREHYNALFAEVRARAPELDAWR